MSAKQAAGKPRKSFVELYSKYGTFAILFACIIAGAILSPNFLTPANLINVIRQNAFLLILAFGATFIMVVGCINIAYDMILACVGCLSCMVFIQTQSMALTLLSVLIMGGLIGLAYGSLVTVFSLPPFIVGLAVTSIAQGLAMIVTGGRSIPGVMGTNYTWFGQGYLGSMPVPILLMLICMVITWFILRKMVFGRHAIAVGGNKNAAVASGIRANHVIRMVYLLDGMLTGLAALVFMSRLGAGQPNPGSGYGFDAITGVVIGGASLSGGSGGAVGTFIGVMIVGILNNVMNLLGMNSYYQLIIKGFLILGAVIIDMKTKEALVKVGTK